MSRKLIVLGLDGATFDIIDPLVEKGELQIFKRLLDGGARGVLSSTIPAATPPAWSSIVSGVNPGKHGIFDFQHIEPDYRTRLVSSRDKRAPEVWDMLESKTCLVANLPFSYPPRRINGIMISGMLTPGMHADFARPHEFKTLMAERTPDYEFDVDWLRYIGRTQKMLTKCCGIVEQREELLEILLERDWDLLFIVITETDRAQHIMWGSHELGILYRRIEEVICRLLSLGDTNLFILSDHGFQGVEKRAYVNNVLEQGCFVVPKRDARRPVAMAREVLRRGVRSFATSSKGERLWNILPDALINRAIEGTGVNEVSEGAIPNHADMEKTTAFMVGQGCIYLNLQSRFSDGIIKEADRKSKAMELIEYLSAYRDPDSGVNVFKRVSDAREIYYGPYSELGPDIVVEAAPGFTLSPRFADKVLERLDAHRGDHHPKGIFIAYGPDVHRVELPDASVYDIAPTILHFMGHGVPKHMDGRVMHEMIPEGSPMRSEIRSIDDVFREKTSRRITDLRQRGLF